MGYTLCALWPPCSKTCAFSSNHCCSIY